MYNLRYHIASLVAVFLALALGLVLGGIVVERGTLDAQRKALVDSLQKDFRRLSAQNRDLRLQVDAESRFADAAATVAVKDRLKGRTVVVVANSGRSDAAQDARKAVESAGGKVAVVLVDRISLGLDEEEVRRSLASVVPTGTEATSASVATSLAAEWAGAEGGRPLTDALVKARVLRLDSFGADASPDAMIIVASADGKPDDVLLSIGQSFKKLGRPTVGAETLNQRTGVAAASADLGLGAVNDLDLAVGMWSTVELVAGGTPAFYGLGSEVDAAFPPLPPAQPAKLPVPAAQ